MRAVLWTALVCSLLIGLNPNAESYAIDTVAPREISFGDLFRILTNELESILRAIRGHVLGVEKDLKRIIDDFILPMTQALIEDSEEDFETLSIDFRDAINDIVRKHNRTQNDFRNDFEHLLIANPKELLAEIEKIIRNKEYRLTYIILNLNITSDPELLSLLLQAIYDYPQSKGELGPLIRKNVNVIIYDRYLQLSDQLRWELKQQVAKLVRCYDKFVNSDINDSDSKESSSVSYEIDIFPSSIDLDALVDKIFDEANFRNKELLDRLLSIF